MYPIGGWLTLLSLPFRRVATGVSSNVLFLGLTSLFTDISSEMVVSVLPAYLVVFLRLTPAQFGVIDGLYHGVTAVVQVLSGMVTDRWQSYKAMAAVGYGLSVLARPALLVTRSWTGIAAVLAVDRLGKGVRTAPRDALISLSSSSANLGTAFGIHRALDAAGAMAGPVLAFLLLAWVPGGFDLVFVASFSAAIIGFSLLVLFVENREPSIEPVQPTASVGAIAMLVRLSRYRHLLLCASALGVATVSDAFVYLALQRQLHFGAGAFPLLYVLTSFGYLALAIPAGRLADRIGRFTVFAGGYGLLLLVDLLLLSGTSGWILAAVILVLLGGHYAATDGVLMALGSSLLPTGVRASGLAVLATATAVARLLSSILFGMVWTQWGLEVALGMFLLGLAGALALSVATRPEATYDAA